MPNSNGQTILITGGSGYIGFETVMQALEAGHAVVAPVRSAAKAASISSHAAMAAHASRLQLPVVADLSDRAAVSSLLSERRIDAIIHLASPLASATPTPDPEADIVAPATGMQSCVLEAAAACDSVRRVAVASSLVTLVPFEWNASPDEARVYTAADLNREPARPDRRPSSSPMEAYWASKALARMQAHDFMRARKPHFKLVNLLPGVVSGPDRSAADEQQLVKVTRKLVLAPVLGVTVPHKLIGAPIDVRDVAAAHLRAVELDLQVGEHGFLDLVLSQPGPEDDVRWNSVIDLARRRFPQHCGHGKALPLGGDLPTQRCRVDAKISEELLGLRFRTMDEMTGDLIAQLVAMRTKA